MYYEDEVQCKMMNYCEIKRSKCKKRCGTIKKKEERKGMVRSKGNAKAGINYGKE